MYLRDKNFFSKLNCLANIHREGIKKPPVRTLAVKCLKNVTQVSHLLNLSVCNLEILLVNFEVSLRVSAYRADFRCLGTHNDMSAIAALPNFHL